MQEKGKKNFSPPGANPYPVELIQCRFSSEWAKTINIIFNVDTNKIYINYVYYIK